MNIVELVLAGDGAMANHVSALASQLRLRGHDVVVAADQNVLDAHEMGESITVPGRLSGTQIRLIKRLVRNCDVVHAHGRNAGLLAATLLTERHRPAFIISWHAPFAGGAARFAQRSADSLGARMADAVTGTSVDLVAQARKAGAKRAWVAEVPSPHLPELLATTRPTASEREALRTELFATLPRAAAPGAQPDPRLPMVLTVGSLIPRKNILACLDAARELRGEITWVVIGRGEVSIDDQLRLGALASRAPLVLAGERGDVSRWLHAAEAFALTSVWEASPLALQEAMAAQVPVVATRTGGIPDLLGPAGRLVEVDDNRGLAQEIRQILDDPQAAEELGRAGRTQIASRPDLAEVAAAWEETYLELIESR
ncbi:MAG: glycosyltransferase family 4 protein [Flaviflexus sp.]|nr:glycosyltransferase family 4 protein [Flaviflexus sp.]